MSANQLKQKGVITVPHLIVLLVVVLLILAVDGYASSSEFPQSTHQLDRTTKTAGDPAVVHRSLATRHRLEFTMGYWESGRRGSAPTAVYTEDMTRVEDLVGAFSYAYWTHDQLATYVTLKGFVVEATSIGGASGISESAVVVTSAMFGIRLYPFSSARTPLRLYASAGLGPYIGVESHKETDIHIVENVKTLGSFGGYLGGGLDIQMGRHLMMGVHVGYNIMEDFPEPLGREKNYSGVEMSAGISVLLGRDGR